MPKQIILFLCLTFAPILLYSQSGGKSPILENNIQLTATGGFQVASAYLAYEDGSRVPKGNKAKLNQKVFVWIIISNGWKSINGKIKVGAAQSIVTDQGNVIIDEKNLFPPGKDEAKLEDGRFISLNARVTALPKKIPYFTVKFSVWDKNGNGKITGSYKLVVKE